MLKNKYIMLAILLSIFISTNAKAVLPKACYNVKIQKTMEDQRKTSDDIIKLVEFEYLKLCSKDNVICDIKDTQIEDFQNKMDVFGDIIDKNFLNATTYLKSCGNKDNFFKDSYNVKLRLLLIQKMSNKCIEIIKEHKENKCLK